MVNGFSKIMSVALLLWIGSSAAFGQYSVKATAMTLDVKDLSQRNTKVLDQNGERCALLVFETPIPKMFSFDLGAQQIEKRENRDDEIRIWVSADVKKMMIRCTDCAPLKDYRVSLKGGNVYRAKLTTGLPQETATSQNVMIYCEHTPFMISIDGSVPVECQDKSYHTVLPLGMHDLMVSSRMYKTYTGTFRVVRTRAYTDTIHMEGNYGVVSFQVTPSHYTVYIDNVPQQVVQNLRLEPGKYQIAIKRDRYETYETSVTIAAGDQRLINASLNPAFAVFSITAADTETEIWVDDQRKGKGSAMIELDYGKHHIECRREGHETWEYATTEFNAMSPRSIKVPKLERQYGGVRLSFFPPEATVYVDGKMVNTDGGTYVNSHMTTGLHFVQTRMTDYISIRDSLIIENGKMSFRDYTMQPIALGVATITTDPGIGMYLKLKDEDEDSGEVKDEKDKYRFLGHTSWTGKLPAGEDIIELRNLSDIRCQYRIFINDKQEHEPVTFPFQRKMMIRTNKGGRKITLRGEKYPEYPIKANKYLKLDPMKYEIKVTKSGYETYKDTIDLADPNIKKTVYRAHLTKISNDTNQVKKAPYTSAKFLQRFYDNAGTLFVGIFDFGYTFDFGGEFGGSLDVDNQQFKHVVTVGALPIRYRMLGLNLADFEFTANAPAIDRTICYRPTISLLFPADHGFAMRFYGGYMVNLYDVGYEPVEAAKKAYIIGGASMRFNYVGKFPMDLFAEYKWPVKGVDTKLIGHKELLFRIGVSFSVGVDCL